MPIAIAVRKDYSDSVFRDTVMRALASPTLTRAYIASGFFDDFSESLDLFAPDFSFNEGMQGKSLFLYGGYDRVKASAKLKALHDALTAKKLRVGTYLPERPASSKDTELVWHAKLAVFEDESGPVLSIVGSSNFTNPSMFGPSEAHFNASIPRVHAEADTYFWKKGCLDADEVMREAVSYWGRKSDTCIAFENSKFDDEVGRLIEHTYQSILKTGWEKHT